MERKQEIELRLSEISETLNTAEKPPENVAELRAETGKLQAEWRALVKEDVEKAAKEAEAEPSGEKREVRALQEKVELRNYLRASVNNSELKGAEAELNAALEVRSAGGVVVPWEALLPSEDDVEQRQDAVTPIPAENLPRTNREIIPRVFAGGVADYLGISMPSVGSGEQVFTYMSDGVNPEAKSKGAAVDADAAEFSTKKFDPLRLTARYLFQVEDLATLSGMESALRSDLRSAMREKMDQRIIRGNGNAPEVDGLLGATAARGGLPDAADPGAVVDEDDILGTFLDNVDGKYATSPGQIRVLVDTETNAKLGKIKDGDVYPVDRYPGQFRVYSEMPAAVANVHQAILVKTGAPGIYAVAPVWQGVELIRDPYTNAAKGQIAITAIALWNFGLVRNEAFKRLKFKLA